MRYDSIVFQLEWGGKAVFGYVKTARDELRLREYDYYRASYCGLCRAMGKCTGQCSRLTLSYDFAYLANVRMALQGTDPAFARRRCFVHPLQKRRMMEPNTELDYAANASAILAFEKCRDDVADERGLRKIKARMQCFALKRAYKRAKKRYPELADGVRARLVELREMEQRQRPSVDEVAAVFGALLGDIFAHGLAHDKARIARTVGQQVGRFIYIVDAADDMAEDQRRGRFNPFLLLYGRLPTAEERETVREALIACLADLEAAFDLIGDTDAPERSAVLKNILYLGMPATVQQVLCGGEDKKEAEK